MKLLKPLWLTGRRNVSTWSPLATAFNTRPTTRPIFDSLRERTGLFQKPELTSFEGFYTLKDQAIAATDRLIEEATSNPTRPMVDIFDELSDTLCQVADLAEFIRIAHPQPHFASAAEEACISISGVVEKLNTHKGLYNALRDSVERGTCGDRHLAELFLFDFEQSGIHLPDGPRQEVVALNDLILQTGQQFMAGAAKPRRVPRSAVPQNVRQFFSSEGDSVVVSGVYAECGEAGAREAAYRLYLAPDPAQEALLTTALRARCRLAQLCGFDCYADRAIKASTMETSANVRQFLDILSDNLHDRANIDFEAMADMKKKENCYQKDLMCWDTPYYTHKAKMQLLEGATSDFSPYFSLGACMEGLNMLCQELYDITLQPEEMLPGESWSPDVYKLRVEHAAEGTLGWVYCDLYARAGKPHQDCHFTVRGGRQLQDSYQQPVVVVMLSLAARRGAPALLPPPAVDNLFHEVGHALHSMLARPRHQHVAGTRCATDLAELPSVLMEHFAAAPEVVRRFARHFQTGAPMPERMLQRLCASKHLFGASEMQLQVFYSALDQQYHGAGAGADADTTAVLRRAQKQYYGLPYVENTARSLKSEVLRRAAAGASDPVSPPVPALVSSDAWQHRFSHLVGYGAKYYSYLISRALAWAAWRRHFAARPLPAAGAATRHRLLKHGGSVPPQILLRDYLDTEITPQTLAMALTEELDYHKDHLDTVFKLSNK